MGKLLSNDDDDDDDDDDDEKEEKEEKLCITSSTWARQDSVELISLVWCSLFGCMAQFSSAFKRRQVDWKDDNEALLHDCTPSKKPLS